MSVLNHEISPDTLISVPPIFEDGPIELHPHGLSVEGEEAEVFSLNQFETTSILIPY
jgi:hypothetical protein